ncbi:conserved hypothetical protein [Methanocella paludicola SANAE]|uniref:S-layer protein n=1 Tax=Methanocella paludicola (strain DSM 17711 / JCM 13418 / NBRC 101707 / SANAE) TaxID=304371 RepID=D1Z2L7_METPS|nr:hypothetical protein [Methanocella paludicola]BAI62939.1 conserved hypothetical protein [Methanocella paludicola SANAE]
MSFETKLRTLLLCALLLAATLPRAEALDGPYLPQTIQGGPIIDASIFGNRELYPGQTTPIQVVIQNSGVIQRVEGYDTPSPYPISITLTVPITNGSDGEDVEDESATTTEATAQYMGDGGYPSGYGISALTGVGSYSITESGIPYFDDFSVNANPNTAIAATTALGVTAKLSTTGAPLQLVSGDCVVGGSLPAGSVSPQFTYIVRVDRGAMPGVYALPLTVTYKHLIGEYDFTSAFGSYLTYNNYVQETVTLYVYVVIREAFDLVVTPLDYGNMIPGSDGMVTLKVSNIGGVCAEECVVYLIPSYPGAPQDGDPSASIIVSPSLVLPVQSSQYVGRMDPGDERPVSFKVAVSPDAEAGTYPLSALVSYTDAWGKQKSSNVDTFGVPVQKEMKFDVDEVPIAIKCGQSCEAMMNLTNIGGETAHDAVVRVNALDPFVVSYDTAYLGDVEPGDTVNTTFGIKVKPDAVPTTYYVTMEVKYYDDQDDPHVTKIIRKAIVVSPPPTLMDKVAENWPLVAGVAILALIGILYAARSVLKRPGRRPPMQKPPTIQEKKE